MKKSTATVACALAAAASPRAEGFAVVPRNRLAGNERSSSAAGMTRTSLRMGLFDGVKDAFSAPSLAKSTIDSERETPIDRWMGWNVQPNAEASSSDSDAAPFLDSMSPSNYVSVSLPKPMGIIFEENDVTSTLNPGGIYVFELSPAGHAAASEGLMFGDQLVGVVTPGKARVVAGEDFDVAISAIKETEEEVRE